MSKQVVVEVSLPVVTADSDIDDLANAMTIAVYAIAIKILERGEYAKILSGNGHHAAQKVAQLASDEVLRRRLDGKTPPGYEVSKEDICSPYEGVVCARCRNTRSFERDRNLPAWDWCHKHVCKIIQWKGRCPDFDEYSPNGGGV